MTVTENPIRNGVDTATPSSPRSTPSRTPEIATFQFRATNRWVSGAQPVHAARLLRGHAGDDPQALHLRCRSPCGAGGPGQRPDAGGVPAPRHRRLPDGRHRQHRRRPGRGTWTRSSRPWRETSTSSGSSGCRTTSATATSSSVSFTLRGDDPKLASVVEQSRRRSAVYDVLTNGVPVDITVDAGDPSTPCRRRPGPFRRSGRCGRTSVWRSRHVRHPHHRHRAGPGRSGDQPLSDRRAGRPRGAGAGPRRRPVARPDVGVAPAPHAELGLAAAGLELPGSATRRVHDAEFAGYLAGYAGSFDAPVEEHSGVRSLRRSDGGFTVDTDRGSWRAANVVIATGWCDKPRLPDFADRLPAGVAQITPDAYRSPDELPPGGVLVVGGSATGVQLADELVRAGREVSRPATTAGCLAATGAWTSGGGSTRPAPSPSRSTRSRPRPGPCRRSTAAHRP